LSSPSSTFTAAGTRALTPLLAFTGTDGVTPTPFLTHSHPFNEKLVKNVIFGVVVVFPVVITFSVAGVLAGRHAQAIVQGFFPWSSPSALIRQALTSAGRCAPVERC